MPFLQSMDILPYLYLPYLILNYFYLHYWREVMFNFYDNNIILLSSDYICLSRPYYFKFLKRLSSTNFSWSNFSWSNFSFLFPYKYQTRRKTCAIKPSLSVLLNLTLGCLISTMTIFNIVRHSKIFNIHAPWTHEVNLLYIRCS